jgi:hypothetical protein
VQALRAGARLGHGAQAPVAMNGSHSMPAAAMMGIVSGAMQVEGRCEAAAASVAQFAQHITDVTSAQFPIGM